MAIPQSARGCAMAMAALTIEAITNRPRRLLWCVDIDRDVGPIGHKADFSSPEPLPDAPLDEYDAKWCATLTRLKDALETGMPYDVNTRYTCRVSMVTRHTLRLYDKRVELTYDLPYCADLTRIAGGNPSVGAWRLIPEYQRDGKPYYLPTEEGRVPDSFWRDGMPF